MTSHLYRIKTPHTHGEVSRFHLHGLINDVMMTGCEWIEIDGERLTCPQALRTYPKISQVRAKRVEAERAARLFNRNCACA